MATRTFLFVDQVGSTEQLARLGDAVAQAVRRGLFDLLRQATEVAGGHEVDFTGDGLFCAFDGAAEAVDAAVAMQQLTWSFNGRQPADRRLAIRIGLNAGEPLESEGGGYFGVAVVVASRLCAAASPGQIMASDVVRSLVAPRGVHTFEPVGGLDLKGVPEPVPASAVRWDPPESGGQLPEALQRSIAAPFVGRAGELDVVRRAWEGAVDGQGRRLVLVSGDQGMGVTRLAAEVARRAHADGATVWFGEGAGRGARLSAWAQAVGGWIAQVPRAELRLAVGAKGADLSRLVPDLPNLLPRVEEPARSDAAAEVFLIADALDEIVARWSGHEPMVVVLDRLHEADQDTLTIARRLVTSTRGGRLLVVACYEPSEVGTPQVLAALGQVSGLVDVRLRGLRRDEVAELMETVTGEPAGEQTVRAVLHESEGLPAFVVRMAVAHKERTITHQVVEAVEAAEGHRLDLRLRREEIALGLRQLDQLRAPDTEDAGTPVEPDGTPPAPVACPYKGLPAFEPEDAADFFGREVLVAELVARLLSSRFLAVVGPSGSGKSSVVRAGLLPALARGAVPGSETWVPVVCRPGAAAIDALDTARSGSGTTVVVIDQFEEVWTAGSADERERLLDLLVEAVGDPQRRTSVVVTLRADYYGHAAAHPGLAALLAESQVLVGPMSRHELRTAIEGPARRAGLVLQPGLAQAVVDDAGVEPGALPLVSTALLETWQRRRGRSLTLAGYAEAGGVRGAIAHLADATFDGLEKTDQEIARRLLLRLAAPGADGDDVARRAPLLELCAGESDEPVLRRLADARLVTIAADGAQVAHEALLRQWPRLRAWLDVDRDGRRLHQQIASAATEWDGGGRDDGALLRGVRLAAATDALESPTGFGARLSALEREYLDRSVAARQAELQRARRTARRFQVFAAGLVVLLLGAVVAGGLAVVQQRTATRRANESDARGLAAQAIALASTKVDTSLLLAAEGYRRDRSLDTEGGLLSALNGARFLVGYHRALPADLSDIELTPDGRALLLLTTHGDLLQFDTITWQPVGEPLMSGLEEVFLITLSPDGRYLAYGNSAGVGVFDLTTRRLLHEGLGGDGGAFGVFSTDGATLVTANNTDSIVGVFDVATGRQRARIDTGALMPLSSIRRGSDEILVADYRAGGTLRRYTLDGEPAGPPVTVPGMDDFVAADYSKDGKQVILGTVDSRMQLLDATTLQPAGPPFRVRGGRPSDHSFSRNGFIAAVASDDGSITLVRRSDGQVETTVTGLTGRVAVEFLDEHRLLAKTATESAEFDLRHVTAIGRAEETVDGALDLTEFPDGMSALVAGGSAAVQVSTSLAEGSLRLDRAGTTADGVAVSGDGSLAAVHRIRRQGEEPVAASIDIVELPSGTVRGTVDVTGSTPEDRLEPHLAFSPDGGTVALGVLSGALMFVDTTRPAVRLPFRAVDTTPLILNALYWTGDGRTLLAGGQDGTLHVLDAGTGQQRSVIPLTLGGALRDARAVPGTNLLAVASKDGFVHFVDLRTLRDTGRSLSARGTQLQGVAPSPDGRRIAAISRDGALRLWDRESGRAIGPVFAGHFGQSTGIAYLDQGRAVVTTGDDGRIISWDLRPSAWLSRACELAGRNLSQEEWRQYLPERPYRRTCGQFPAG